MAAAAASGVAVLATVVCCDHNKHRPTTSPTPSLRLSDYSKPFHKSGKYYYCYNCNIQFPTTTSDSTPTSSSRSGSYSSTRSRSNFKCKAVGDSSVYQGIYGPWTVDPSDVREARFSFSLSIYACFSNYSIFLFLLLVGIS